MKEIIMSKTDALLQHLKANRTVSPREAMLDLNIGSHTKEIHRLRDRGHRIMQVWRKNPTTGQRYSRYYYIGLTGEAA